VQIFWIKRQPPHQFDYTERKKTKLETETEKKERNWKHDYQKPYSAKRKA